MTNARVVAVLTSLVFFLSSVLATEAQREGALPQVQKVTVNAPVTLTDNGDSWTLDNGIVKMTVLKRNGNLSSLVYHGIEVLTRGEYWEQTPSGTISAKVTIDPSSNGGERAEVSVLGVNPGDRNNPSPLGGPPGGGVPAAQEQRVPGAPGGAGRPGGLGAPGGPRPGGARGGGIDIEVRYTHKRGTSGFYTYADNTHKAAY